MAAGPDGRILAVGDGARAAAGRDAVVHDLSGAAWPGLHDAHIHLEHLALRRLGLELEGISSRGRVLERVRAGGRRLPAGAWLVGRGWYNDEWLDDASWPRPEELDAVAVGRPVFLVRKDGHSAWLSTRAYSLAGIDPSVPVKETLVDQVRKLL
ncbi:MAG: hypothetical protein E6J02_13245, partial [Chloroflexi bacterium]